MSPVTFEKLYYHCDMMSDQELEKLAHPEFWDERYATATAEADTPTHEWFRTFDELLPFLEPNLFGSRAPLTNPKILPPRIRRQCRRS